MTTVAGRDSYDVRGLRRSSRFRAGSDLAQRLRGLRTIARRESFVEPFVLPVGHGQPPSDDEQGDDRDPDRLEVQARERIPKRTGEPELSPDQGEDLDASDPERDDHRD